MKKLFALMLAMLMVVSLVACKSNNTNTDPTTDPSVTEPSTPGEDDDAGVMEGKIKFTFSNDSVTVNVNKIELDKATNKIYQYGIDGNKPEQAILNKLVFVFYDADPQNKPYEGNPEDVIVDVPQVALTLTCDDTNFDLLGAEDMTHSVAFPLSTIEGITGALPGEFLRELKAREYTQVAAQVFGEFEYINGENAERASFQFNAFNLEFEEAFDTSAIVKVPVTLTDTGATINTSLDDLCKAWKLDKASLKAGDKLNISYIELFSAKGEVFLAADKETELTITDNMTDVVLNITYTDAATWNHKLYQEVHDENMYPYVLLELTTTGEEQSTVLTAYIMAELTAEYTAPEGETTVTPEVTEPSESTDIPDDTTGGNEE